MKKLTFGLLGLLLVALLITAGCGNPKPKGKKRSSLDYFKIKEGFGIKYQVTDSYPGSEYNSSLWAVSQYFSNDTDHEIDFLFTLHGDSNESSLGGEVKSKDGLTWFYAGAPCTNQGNFYMDFSLPRYFTDGMQWQTWPQKSYIVKYVGAQTVNGINFADCIKVSYSRQDDKEEYYDGTGYFILAKDIGIVKIVFNRTNGSVVTFDYQEHQQLERHTISGTIVESGSPVKGIAVQIAYDSWGTQSITEEDGRFSIQAYGPEVNLIIGYDHNQDGIIDDKGYRYLVKDITKDVYLDLKDSKDPKPTEEQSFELYKLNK